MLLLRAKKESGDAISGQNYVTVSVPHYKNALFGLILNV